ncbi:SDR family oxidoreductase [Secundilactobacillus collinoides]|uniref:SDR family oxidoreductase n=1 Tax=Secundilactobacillus collinoides TaxID=33960 RepID=UPI0007AE67C4|nr:NmrA family NAD(P)-binding protein [Secundilactobacillus collinoides]
MKVLVTASFGHIGQKVIPLLAANNVDVRAVDPDPKNTAPLKKLGAKEVIVGDIRRDEIIDKAVAGVDKVLLILPDALSGMVPMATRLIEAAKKNNVTHFVFSSCLNTVMELIQHWEKYEIEDELMGSTLNYTITKPSGYMEGHFPTGPGSVFETGVLTSFMKVDQPSNLISLDDIAAANVKVLLSDDEYYACSLDLCTNDNRTTREYAQEICDKTNQTLKVNMIPIPDFPSVHANDQFGRIAAYHGNHPYKGNPLDFNAVMERPAKSFSQYVDDVLASK